MDLPALLLAGTLTLVSAPPTTSTDGAEDIGASWQAMAVICFGPAAQDCLLLEDQRGPYGSRERCAARAREMMGDAALIFGPAPRYTAVCRAVGEAI